MSEEKTLKEQKEIMYVLTLPLMDVDVENYVDGKLRNEVE